LPNIATTAVALYMLVGEGVGAALVKLAGGGTFVLGSVGISVALHVITEGRDVTWESFFEAVLMGYLQALGFRAFAPVGRRVGGLLFGKIAASVLTGKLTASVIARGVAAIVLQKTIIGVGGGGSTGLAFVFVTDLLRIMREGGGLSSWERYFAAAGEGAWMGLIGEFLIGPGLSFLGSATRGTSIHKVAAALGGGLESSARSRRPRMPSGRSRASR
jgi:hypothetical protein